MNPTDITKILNENLRRIAPDIDIASIDTNADLREEFDIDSLDFLNLVTALGKALKIEIPEADYPQLVSYTALLSYLNAKSGAS